MIIARIGADATRVYVRVEGSFRSWYHAAALMQLVCMCE